MLADNSENAFYVVVHLHGGEADRQKLVRVLLEMSQLQTEFGPVFDNTVICRYNEVCH